MVKKFAIILAVLLMATTVSAEISKIGACGAQFLKIGVGSRYQAMAEASVATANDVYAAHRASLPIIAVKSPFGRDGDLEISKPDLMIERLDDLLDILK